MAGVGTEAGETGEVGDDVIGAEAVRVERRPVLLQATGEAGQRLPVGLDGAGRLAFDGAAGQVGLDEGWEERRERGRRTGLLPSMVIAAVPATDLQHGWADEADEVADGRQRRPQHAAPRPRRAITRLEAELAIACPPSHRSPQR